MHPQLQQRRHPPPRLSLQLLEGGERLAINLYGPSGTGKTMTAEAIAARLGRPVLVVSYDARADTRQAAREVGAQAFITKPCNCGDLLDAVNRLCS